MRIRDVFLKRRSVYNFREDFEMNENDFRAIFELARYSPTVYNTQSVRYLVTTDKDKQAKLKELCHGQHKILTASGVILVLSKKDFLDESNIDRVYRSSVQLGIMEEGELDTTKARMKMLKDSLDTRGVELEVYRNVFTNVGMLLSIATILGFDTCPMHVHNVEEIRKLFNVPEDLEIVFMVPIGKAVEDKIRPRGYRHQVSELLTFESY